MNEENATNETSEIPFEIVTRNINRKDFDMIKVTFEDITGKSREAVFHKRLRFGDRANAVEIYGDPTTDLNSLGVLAAFSIYELDGAPVMAPTTKEEATDILNRLDDPGVIAYGVVCAQIRKKESEAAKAAVGNS